MALLCNVCFGFGPGGAYHYGCGGMFVLSSDDAEPSPSVTYGPETAGPLVRAPPVVEPEAFVKHDAQKPRFSLMPPKALQSVLAVIEYGAKKYAPGNWKKAKVDERDRYLDALYRHLEAYRAGEKTDAESGLSHLAHAGCNILFLLGFQEGDA